MKTARLALFAAIAQCAAAFAQDLPGQVDLRAAYCIGVHKALESNDQSIRELGDSPPDPLRAIMRKHVAERDRNRLRLNGYLFPRIGMLEPTGLFVAMNTGKSDMDESTRLIAACMEQCEPQRANECALACAAYPSVAMAKARSCVNLSWLPY